MEKPKVIVICGPTASGKTKLSVELAKKIDGEIICCDSMQIYKDMNIGTAKVTKEEILSAIPDTQPTATQDATTPDTTTPDATNPVVTEPAA